MVPPPKVPLHQNWVTSEDFLGKETKEDASAEQNETSPPEEDDAPAKKKRKNRRKNKRRKKVKEAGEAD